MPSRWIACCGCFGSAVLARFRPFQFVYHIPKGHLNRAAARRNIPASFFFLPALVGTRFLEGWLSHFFVPSFPLGGGARVEVLGPASLDVFCSFCPGEGRVGTFLRYFVREVRGAGVAG